MRKRDDPYDRMSDKDLEAHLLSLSQGRSPVAASGAASVVISLRLPQEMLDRLRAAARLRGEGYQTLMKRWLDERLGEDAGVEPPPDWDSLPEDVVSNVVLTPGQLRTLATRGELLFRVRSSTRRGRRASAPAAGSRERGAGQRRGGEEVRVTRRSPRGVST